MASKSFKIFMYEDEINYLKWIVLQKPDIETGGDLFGLWQNEVTAVVQLVLGPGKKCSRTTTSFYQDVQYLSEVGQALTSTQGLCNVGEWHSHHRIGLARPSYGDENTVWNHMHDVAGGRFLLFIANIEGPIRNPIVNIGCFVFHCGHKKILNGKIKALHRPSPLRSTLNKSYMKPGAEKNQDWETFQNTTKSVSQSRENEDILTSLDKEMEITKCDSDEKYKEKREDVSEESSILERSKNKGKCRRFLSWLGEVLCCCFNSLKRFFGTLCCCISCCPSACCSCCPPASCSCCPPASCSCCPPASCSCCPPASCSCCPPASCSCCPPASCSCCPPASCSCCPCACGYQQSTGHTKFDETSSEDLRGGT